MANVASASEQNTDLLKKLSLDSKTDSLDVPEATKKNYESADSLKVASAPMSTFERPASTSLSDFVDPNMCYFSNAYSPYYFGGYDGPINEWEDYHRYFNPDGVDLPNGLYGDSGSVLYHHGYGYPPYGAYPPAGSPVPTMAHDGQFYGPQHYQYGNYYPSSAPSIGPYSAPAATRGDVSTSVAMDQRSSRAENGNGNSNGFANGNVNGSTAMTLKPGSQDGNLASYGSYGRGVIPSVVSSGFQDPRFGFDGWSPIPRVDGHIFSDGQPRLDRNGSPSLAMSNIPSTSQGLRPPHLMGLHPPRMPSVCQASGFASRMYPNSRACGQYGNAVRSVKGFGNNLYDSRAASRGWSVDKLKQRGRGGCFGYGNENMGELIELNRGPRAGQFNNQMWVVPNSTAAVKEHSLTSNGNKEDSVVVPDRDQYNCTEFSIDYSDAKFFIIKSYSEDDIHKSIKYGVWASTPNGNKKLDAGYGEACAKKGGCPVFLFFSVNTSGQFVGLAEMVGPVDFDKNLDYWQQDKWIGCFPVKWHIVKDIPNGLLKHITLENNENKPVTNSRDTQEVKFEQGLEMLKIFKDHISKTSILDDFGFYEVRQKTMQEKKAKQQQFRKQNWDVKTNGCDDEKEKGMSNDKMRLQKPLETDIGLEKDMPNDKTRFQDPLETDVGLNKENGEQKPQEENVLVNLDGAAANGVAKIMENGVLAHVDVDGC